MHSYNNGMDFTLVASIVSRRNSQSAIVVCFSVPFCFVFLSFYGIYLGRNGFPWSAKSFRERSGDQAGSGSGKQPSEWKFVAFGPHPS